MEVCWENSVDRAGKSQIKTEKRLSQRSRKFMSYKQKDKRMSRALSSRYQKVIPRLSKVLVVFGFDN